MNAKRCMQWRKCKWSCRSGERESCGLDCFCLIYCISPHSLFQSRHCLQTQGTRSSSGPRAAKRRPRVEAEGSLADNVPHCDKALNVDSVSQRVQNHAATDRASLCACTFVRKVLLRSCRETMGQVWARRSGGGNIVNRGRCAHQLPGEKTTTCGTGWRWSTWSREGT